ncbi:hypothetical protein [Streptomyces sp. NPDC001404]|uniref:hypothetical protein n=1 Tax=Streptomyces sp. NPDC001404 TaxID=3364571 RepID=UPI0036761757
MDSDGFNGVVERLLSAADGTEDETAAVLGDLDGDVVARAVLGEIAARAALFEGATAPVTVQFDVGTPDGRLDYLVTVGDGPARCERGRLREPWVLVRQDLTDLLRSVYGPAGAVQGGTLEVTVRDEDPPGSTGEFGYEDRHQAVRAAHQLTKACSARPVDLDLLAVRFRSDKWGGHWYTPHYERHFGARRDQRVKLLEIGVGGYHAPDVGGASLLMWKHYFRRGLVYGLDVFDKSALDEPRKLTVRGDQSDPEFLNALAKRIGPLDIVIDDGSHRSSDVITSFRTLFPHLRPGGLYVIEDLQTSYWPGWNGGRTHPDDEGTSVGHLKTVVDGLHHMERPGEPSATDRTVTAIHLYPGVAFVEKGINSDRPAPAWIRRDVDPAVWMADPSALSTEEK